MKRKKKDFGKPHVGDRETDYSFQLSLHNYILYGYHIVKRNGENNFFLGCIAKFHRPTGISTRPPPLVSRNMAYH